MEQFQVKDKSLAPQGHLQIEWAAKHMPVLNIIKTRFEKEKPLKGQTLAACLHVTKETAVLIKVLIAGGAKVALCGSNPLSTQDDVAAALADSGVHVFAWRGQNTEDYYKCIEKVLDFKPTITMDDGADVVGMIHSKRPDLIKNIKGGTEETTTGVVRLKAMEQDGSLKYPIVAVNEALTKYLFDNRYGTGQSTIDGILRATSVLLAGKNFVVGGYGWCSRGIAMRAQGLGANVIVTEVQPTRALEAVMNGLRVMTMAEAAPIGDIFVTATGDINVIRKEHMQKMKDGAIMCNSGHFNVEINIPDLESLSQKPNAQCAQHGRIHIQRRQTPLPPRRRSLSEPSRRRRSPQRSHGHVFCQPSTMQLNSSQNPAKLKPKSTMYQKTSTRKSLNSNSNQWA